MSVRTDYLNLVVNVNGNPAKKEYSELKAKQAQISAELREMKKGTQEYIAKSKELEDVTRRIDQMRGQLDLASLSIKDLRKEISRMRAVQAELDPASDAFRQMGDRIRTAQGRLNDLTQGTDFATKAFNFLKREVLAFGAIAVAALGIDFIIGKVSNLIQRNAELSDSFADVAKTTGLTVNQVKELSKEISGIDTRTSKRDLLDLATIAGKLGKTSQEDILGFVNAMNQLNVALGEDLGDAEEVSKKLGKLIQTFQVEGIYGTEQALLKVGSAINTLGASSTANEGYLVDFSNRMGGVAPLANISIQQILGLGATLDQFGQTAEVSSTALSKLFVKMSESPEKFSKYANMEVSKFKKLIDEDFMSAFIAVLEGIGNNADGMNSLVESLGDLGVEGGRVTGVLGVLANNTQTLRDQINLSNDAFAKGTSVTDEYALKNENLAAKVEKLKKEFVGLWQSDAINNFIVSLIDGFAKAINSIKEFGSWVQRNAMYIRALAAAFATYYTAVIATYTWSNRLILLQKAQAIAQGILSAAIGAYSIALQVLTGRLTLAAAAQRAKNAAMLANPYAAVAAAVMAISVAVAGLIKRHKELKEQFEKEKIVLRYKVQMDELKSDVIENMNVLKAQLSGLSGDKLEIAAAATANAAKSLEEQLDSDQAKFDLILWKIRLKRDEIERQDQKFLGGSRSKANELEQDLKNLNTERDEYKKLIDEKKKALKDFESVNVAYQEKINQLKNEEKSKEQELTEKQKEEREKRLEQLRKQMEEVKKAISDFERERQLAALSSDQREIEAIGAKYEKYLNMTQKFSAEYNRLVAFMLQEVEEKQSEHERKLIEQRQKAQSDMQNLLEQEKDKQWLSKLSDEQREIAQLGQHYDTLYQKLQEAKAKDLENEAFYNALEKQLEETHRLGVLAIRDRFRAEEEKKQAEHLRKKAELEREITNNPWLQQNQFEAERQRVREHYDNLERDLKEHYGKKAEDAQRYAELQQQIAEQREAALTAIELEETAARRDARVQSYQAIAGATGDFINMLFSEQQQMTKAQKAATLLQISMDTASAISSLTKMSEANPANAVTFGGAGALQFAAGLIRIMANIGMAFKTLSAPTTADRAQTRVPQRAKGGYHEVTGMDDNRTYSAKLLPGFENGYLTDPSLVLAGENGKEYFVNNTMLQNPTVARVVQGIEELSRGRINTADFSSLLASTAHGGRNPSTGETITIATPKGPVKQPVGTSTTGKPSNKREGDTNTTLLDAIERLNQLLASGIKAEAYIGDQTTIDLKKRQQYLDKIENQAN